MSYSAEEARLETELREAQQQIQSLQAQLRDGLARVWNPKLVVVESPLNGKTAAEFQRNYRFALWCERAEYEAGFRPIASHTNCPFFMDDTNQKERSDGIAWPWFWLGHAHVFYEDLGKSTGMGFSLARCEREGIAHRHELLATRRPDMWAAFERGEWPPHTPGFDLASPEVSIFNRATEAILGGATQ